MNWLSKLWSILQGIGDIIVFSFSNKNDSMTQPQNPTTPAVPTAANPDVLVAWDAPADCRHNVRVICDLVGLTLDQKNILTACVADESGFLTNPRPNRNKDKNGVVWSTDYGIVQVNDYFHIGPGKDFPSVQYVLDNPEACVRWMAEYYKTHGNLNAWASYTSGVYKNYL